MKTVLGRYRIAFSTLVSLLWLLALADPYRAAGADNSDGTPAGSLVFRGPAKSTSALDMSNAAATGSPEYLFGMSVEQAMKTNGSSVLTRAFDLDVFYHRFVPTLPASEETKQRLYAVPHSNEAMRRQILNDVASTTQGRPIRYLGVRTYGLDTELLFRDAVGPDIAYWAGDPLYVGFVSQRRPDGSIRLVDAHPYVFGPLLSFTVRRQTLFELARKKFVVAPNDSDVALVSSTEAINLFQSRCSYGHYNLIKAAFEKLPAALQDDRTILLQFATSGEQSINDILVPIERWRRVYPDDPSPNLLLVDFYWRLYHGPRYVESGRQQGVHAYAAWAPQDEEGALAAIQKANAWFADPAMEVRLAKYFGSARPDKARPLLLQAMKRFPVEPSTFAELIKLDLATTNYFGVADTLRQQEVACQTNLTAMVDASKDYIEFRKSFPWKKWQHDFHGADAKALTGAPAR